MSENKTTVTEAKQILKDAGYFTDNLWSVDDVKGHFEVTTERAQEILKYALTGEGTMGAIWQAIEDADMFFDDLTKIN